MKADDSVDSQLATLRSAMHSVAAPAGLEDVLTARFRRHHQVRRPSLWWIPPLALAATVALVSWTIRSTLPPLPLRAAAAARPDPGPFLALKPLQRIALEPGSTIVTTEFPRALLADWGLPVSPDRADEPVRAEMLYSPAGEALAIRLVN